jgi:hypothetical protein
LIAPTIRKRRSVRGPCDQAGVRTLVHRRLPREYRAGILRDWE